MNTKDEKSFFRFILAALALIALILAWGGAAQCQSVDIQIPRPTSDYVAVRNLVLGSSGTGGFNNVFVFQSLYSQESICLSIFNGSSSNESIQVNISATNDPGITAFTGNTSRWNSQIAMEGTTNNAGNVTINAGSWAQFYAQSSGAARIAIVLTGSSAATGTADIVISQSQTQTASVAPGTIISSSATANPSVLNLQLNSFFTNRSGNTAEFLSTINNGSLTPAPLSVMPFLLDGSGTLDGAKFANGVADASNGIGTQSVGLSVFDGTNWDRMRGNSNGISVATQTTASDGLANNNIEAIFGGSGGTLIALPAWTISSIFNGSTWDRTRSASAINTSSTTSLGAAITEKGGRWPLTSSPATGTQATASKAAGGAGVRHVIDCISWGVSDQGAAGTPILNIRDGATGAGTVLWTITTSVTATAQDHNNGTVCGLNLIGTANTAMTCEFNAGVASVAESVSCSGYDVQ